MGAGVKDMALFPSMLDLLDHPHSVRKERVSAQHCGHGCEGHSVFMFTLDLPDHLHVAHEEWVRV